MKVWIDGTVFENRNQHGIWRVFYELLSRTRDQVDYTLALRSPPLQPIPDGISIYRDVGRIDLRRHQLVRRAQRRLAETTLARELDKVDVFHSTGFTYPGSGEVRSVTTVHDMIAESHFSMCATSLADSIPIKEAAIRRACLLPCDSESTAAELARFYPELASRARVVPFGAEHLRRAGEMKDRHSDRQADVEPYVLYVGQRGGYKNFFTLLDALQKPDWPHQVSLKLIGGPLTHAEKGLIRGRSLTRQVQHLGAVSDAELCEAYRNAVCLVFPSLQEGFGLPSLEAQSMGCPLLCSDIPVFREIAGDGARYFDPRIGESIAGAVAACLAPVVRRDLIAAGRANVMRFSWDQAADQMVNLYHDAARLDSPLIDPPNGK